MNTIERNGYFASTIVNSVQGLEKITDAQLRAMEKALDVDGSGQVSYIPEYGSAHGFVTSNYAKRTTQGSAQLAPGVDPGEVVAGLQRRKALIAGIAEAFEDKTFAEAQKEGSGARYFGGFFRSTERTLKDEIRDVAHGLRSFGQLEKLSGIIDRTPRNAEGKITFKAWDDVLFLRLQGELGVRPMGRLLHGAQWGDL